MRYTRLMITGLVAAQLCAACSSGDDLIVPDDNLHPISFSTADTSAQITRADNNVGLQTLGINEIKVYGYKMLTATAQDGTKTTTPQNVMPGYTLKYVDGTANSSTSNTTGWEYVGLTDATTGEAVKDYMNKVQEIKYWDGNCSDYRFFGVIPNDKYTLKYDGNTIDKDTKIDDTKSFTMEFPNLTYMTRTYDATNQKYKYLTYKTDNDGNTTSEEIQEKAIPMYGTMWQGDPKDNYDKPVTLAFSKPYALIRIVFVRPDGTSVAELGDTGKAAGEDNYAAKFNPTDKSKISTDGSVKVTWSMKGTEESTTAESTEQKLPAMNFNPIKLEEAETRYQAWPEYVMVPTTTDASTGTSSSVDYECTVFVKEETTSGKTTSSNIVKRTAFVPKEFTHWKAGYEYTYVFKITYNNSLEFSHVVETYTKWQAGYVDTTKW